jgi:serine/threonine-protein kinase HipA
LTSSRKGIAIAQKDGLPGVVRDAMPAGYGADRLEAGAERKLSSMELLEVGVSDSCGAIEVCKDIQKKLDWVPHEYGKLRDIIALMSADEPASRAIRKLTDDASTSAGGERPKVTIQDGGRLFLAKMQARSDIAFLPGKEYVVMRRAGESGIRTPAVRLETVGKHVVYLVERFDRAGDPNKPERKLYASAHTVLRLDIDPVKGDPKRSYLALGDEMRVWCRRSPYLVADLHELWKRMAFNALVGNSDDHPKNHGLLYEGDHWRLAPAFDITPLANFRKVLAMATAVDGSCAVSVSSLLATSPRFELGVEEAAAWLSKTASCVANTWESDLRGVGVSEPAIQEAASSFSFALEVASDAGGFERAAAEAMKPAKRMRRPA